MFKFIGSAYCYYFLALSSSRGAVPILTVCSVFFVAAIYTSHVLKTKKKNNRTLTHGVPLTHLADMFQQVHFFSFQKRRGVGVKQLLNVEVCVVSFWLHVVWFLDVPFPACDECAESVVVVVGHARLSRRQNVSVSCLLLTCN